MAATNDTIADIIAEMNRVEVCADGKPCLRDYADRLEAAHRRERGDCAKLREALRECAQYVACLGGIGAGEVTINDNVHLIPGELTQKAIAALEATKQEGGAK